MNPGELSQLQQAIADALARYGQSVLTYIVQRPSQATELAEPELQSIAVDPNVTDPLTSALAQGGGQAELTTGIVWGGRFQAAIDYARSRAAEMVGMRRLPNGRLVQNPNPKWSIPQTTRDDLQKVITQILEDGGNQAQLKDLIEQHPSFPGLFGEYRAEMIARSELAMAQNAGVVEGYRQGGVEAVRVLDNPRCPTCAPYADTIQTIQWASENPIQHPFCQRAFNSATLDRLTAQGNNSAVSKDGAGAGAAGASGGGIGTGTGLTGYNLEGQHDDCEDENCKHESHKDRART